MKRVMKSKTFIGIMLCIISCGIGVYAANTYKASDVIYIGSDGTSMNVKQALDELYAKTECEKDNFCSKVKIGDYIKMTPTKTSYTVNSTKTGWKESSNYSSDDTINPSELNLWRVIKKNDDGTIEMVSEYVSSTSVHFYGKTGYLNLVGELNKIASQYENSKYTTSSRIMGYNGQTEYITDTSIFTSPPSLTENTINNNNEPLGGGDIMFKYDCSMVYDALGTLITNNPPGTTASYYGYYLGSRFYINSGNASTNFFTTGRVVSADGEVSHRNLSFFRTYSAEQSWIEGWTNSPIRPILTLKSGLTATGLGTSTDPWVLK